MELLVGIIVLVFSAILHEIMHGFVAERLGDPTARIAGRLTLNPIPHIDPFMSILIPALLILTGSPVIFGAAKPVPVNPIHFREPKKDMALTALAGPLTNIGLALLAALLIKTLGLLNPIVSPFLISLLTLNLILAIINLIPIPPLDGSKVVSAFLPDHIAAQYLSIAPFGFFIVFALLLFTPLGSVIRSLLYFSVQLIGL